MATPDRTVVEVSDHHVSCDGVGGALGHPLTYYVIGKSGRAECTYCDRVFVLKEGASHGH
jgi:uncharacterized Zn-finger protein